MIELAKKELGWEPGIRLEEGLERTIAYFNHVLEHESIIARFSVS